LYVGLIHGCAGMILSCEWNLSIGHLAMHFKNGPRKTWRPAFRMLSWQTTGRYAKSSTKDHAVLAFLSQDQVTNNTTRGSIPGLVNPFLGEANGRVPLPAMKLGEGLSRSQVARLRAEQQRKQLQDMEPDFTSESLSHDPSEEVVDNDAAQGFPGKAKSLAHTAEKSSQENMIATWPPGIQSRYVSTKHPYPCHRPSTHHIMHYQLRRIRTGSVGRPVCTLRYMHHAQSASMRRNLRRSSMSTES